MNGFSEQSLSRPLSATGETSIFHRIACKEQAAIADCIDRYGSFVWTLARKFTASQADAEAVTEEIFADIWQRGLKCDEILADDHDQISRITRRHLFDHLSKSGQNHLR